MNQEQVTTENTEEKAAEVTTQSETTQRPEEAIRPKGKWFGQMGIPRELSIKDGRLIQKPVREIENLRTDKLVVLLTLLKTLSFVKMTVTL